MIYKSLTKDKTELDKEEKDKVDSLQATTPVRLYGLKEAARYCSLSIWTLRALVLSGDIPSIQIPDPNKPGRTLRRVLIDIRDLDTFLDNCRINSDGKEN